MNSSCFTRRSLAEQFAIAARLYAESAVHLASSETSGIEYTRLRHVTVLAQGDAQAAFRALTDHVAIHQCGGPSQDG